MTLWSVGRPAEWRKRLSHLGGLVKTPFYANGVATEADAPRIEVTSSPMK